MKSVRLRAAVALSAFLFGLALDAFVNTSSLVEKALSYPVMAVDNAIGSPPVEVPQRAVAFDPAVPTSIMFERIQPACFGCDPRRVIMYTAGTDASSEDAAVIEVNLRTGLERRGKLDSYFYRNLMSFIIGQGYFAMTDQHFRGTTESPVVRTEISVGDRSRWVVTGSGGQVSSALWGIHYAIEGVVFHVQWEH